MIKCCWLSESIMSKSFLTSAIFQVFLLCSPLYAQIATAVNFDSSARQSLWSGFDRYDFEFKQRNARLIVPNKPLTGNPWVWRARFPDWHTEADSILVSEGYHVAYINTDNKYGSPDAVQIWDEFFENLTERHNLSRKVSLIGVSRGGLFIYKRPLQNPVVSGINY